MINNIINLIFQWTRDTKFSQGQNTGMDNGDDLLKDNRFIMDITF